MTCDSTSSVTKISRRSDRSRRLSRADWCDRPITRRALLGLEDLPSAASPRCLSGRLAVLLAPRSLHQVKPASHVATTRSIRVAGQCPRWHRRHLPRPATRRPSRVVRRDISIASAGAQSGAVGDGVVCMGNVHIPRPVKSAPVSARSASPPRTRGRRLLRSPDRDRARSLRGTGRHQRRRGRASGIAQNEG
jgi:hypothetical protein